MSAHRRRFGHLTLEWDAGELAIDPFAMMLPLEVGPALADGAAVDRRAPDIRLTARVVADPRPDPGASGASTVLYHGSTQCFLQDGELVLWDRASTVRVARGGRRIEAQVHESSLEQVFHFSSVTVMMALLLALRSHGLYHLHAAAACWPDRQSWLVPGESSSGKSTLALALFASGANWLSDDALLLSEAVARTGAVDVLGWARPIRMTSRTAAAFPELHDLLRPSAPGSDRDHELDPHLAFPGRGMATAPSPFTLVFPRIVGEPETRVMELERAEALGRLLHACAWVASSHLPDRQRQLALLGRLVDSARSYDVAVGSRILSQPRQVVEQLRDRIEAP